MGALCLFNNITNTYIYFVEYIQQRHKGSCKSNGCGDGSCSNICWAAVACGYNQCGGATTCSSNCGRFCHENASCGEICANYCSNYCANTCVQVCSLWAANGGCSYLLLSIFHVYILY